MSSELVREKLKEISTYLEKNMRGCIKADRENADGLKSVLPKLRNLDIGVDLATPIEKHIEMLEQQARTLEKNIDVLSSANELYDALDFVPR